MIRIYIVEDHRMIREMLCAIISEERDLEVVAHAGDAEQALNDLQFIDVDIVLMDIDLPGMSGLEASRRINQKYPKHSVIMLSSYDEHVEKAIVSGAKGYIMKTSPPSELIQAIRWVQSGNSSIDPSLTARLFHEIRQPTGHVEEADLTNRQKEIIGLVANGLRHKDTADRLSLSETTVNREMRAIFDKLGVNDAAHAVSESYKRGVLRP